MANDARRQADAQRSAGYPTRKARPLKLVVDASVVVPAAIAGTWSARLIAEELHAPTLMWSEVAATLRQLEWRGEISSAIADQALVWLTAQDIAATTSARLVLDARRLAAELGWAKTYDAEYVVLARRLQIPLATVDLRLSRTVSPIVDVVDPAS